MNWVDFNGTAVDMDEIVYVKRGPWSNGDQKDFATLVHKSGLEIKVTVFYVEVINLLRLLPKKNEGLRA